MLYTNFNVQNTNIRLSSHRNVFKSGQNNQAVSVLQAGGRRGNNTSSVPPALKAHLLKMCLAADDMQNSIKNMRNAIHGYTVIQEIAQTEAARQAENLNSFIERLRYVESHIPRFTRFDIAFWNYLKRSNFEASVSANDLAAASGYINIGDYKITLNIGIKSIDVYFSVSPEDTIRDIQQIIANEVNAMQNNDFFASISYDSETGKSILSVHVRKSAVTANTGPIYITSSDPGFQLSVHRNWDEERALFNLLEKFDMGPLLLTNVFTFCPVHGVLNGVNWDIFEPHELLGGPRFKNQSELAWQEAMRAFLENFNAMLEAGGEDYLGEELADAAEEYSDDLESVGITTNSSGFLQIDETRMTQAAESGEFSRLIFDGGRPGISEFINRVERIIERLISNPPGSIFDTEV